MSKVKIPAKQFSQFVDASMKWLAKTADFKYGLEVSFEVVSDVVLCSVGADSSFFKVSFPVAEPTEGDFERIFLDLAYLAKLPLDENGIIAISTPKVRGDTDKRIAISHNGMNFKIPQKTGDVWEKNKHDFQEHEVTTFVNIEGRELFDTIYSETVLPSSFGLKQQNLICFHKKAGKEGVFAYTEDGFGAFCHQFKKGGITFSEGSDRIPILYEFFLPIVKVDDLASLKVYSSDRYVLGSAKSESFKSFHWIQPKLQREVDDLEEFLDTTRKEPKDIVELTTKEFVLSVKNAMVFFKDANIKDTPLQFMSMAGKYSVSAALPTTSTMVEGVTLTNNEKPVRVFFQAASLRDYLNMLTTDKPFIMEAYKGKVILMQQTEDISLCYLLPILER